MARPAKYKPKSVDVDVDPERLVLDAITNNFDIRAIEGIDDTDIPQARNVVDWCTSPNFMASTMFAAQAEVLVRTFAEWCPQCTDADYMRDVPVGDSLSVFQDRVQLLDQGVCPHCGKNRVELFEFIPEELVAVWGQRSGKSITAAAQGATYQLHRFLKIPHVAKYFGQHQSQKFDITFTAVDASQAQSTLWHTFITAYRASPWFRTYENFVRQQCAEIGIPDQVKLGETFVFFGGSKNIMVTFKAPNMSSLRGATRIYTATDELSFMSKKENAIRANATEVYNSLANSLRTIRSASARLRAEGKYNAPTGLMVNISSPLSSFDKTMMLLKDGDRDKLKVCSHRATWEVNPNEPKKNFASTLLTNPMVFWRDFAALPPLGDSAFLGSDSNLSRMVGEHEPIFRTKSKYVTDALGTRYVAAEILQSTIKPDKQTPRIVAVDAGESGNSFAIAVYSAIQGDATEVGLRVDAVIEVAPETDRAADQIFPVHFPTMHKLMVEITKHFNVHVILWDRWQSTGEIQRLREQGIKSERYSPRYDDFLILRNKIWSGMVRAVAPEVPLARLKEFDIADSRSTTENPWSHLYIQTATVRAIGKKVAKPQSGEDDLFRTMVLASHWVQDPQHGIEMLAASSGLAPAMQQKAPSVMVFSYANRSSGGSGTGGGGSGAVVVRTSTGGLNRRGRGYRG